MKNMRQFADHRPLREYLRSLSLADQAAYAAACGTTVGYLRSHMSRNTRLDIALMVNLVRHSRGRVPFAALRKDVDWDTVRRELTRKHVPPMPVRPKTLRPRRARAPQPINTAPAPALAPAGEPFTSLPPIPAPQQVGQEQV